MLKKFLQLASPWQPQSMVGERAQVSCSAQETTQLTFTVFPMQPSDRCLVPQVDYLVGRGHGILIHVTDDFYQSVTHLFVLVECMTSFLG